MNNLKFVKEFEKRLNAFFELHPEKREEEDFKAIVGVVKTIKLMPSWVLNKVAVRDIKESFKRFDEILEAKKNE